MNKRHFLALFLIFFSSLSSAEPLAGEDLSEEAARIQGVAEFLIDRANDNYLYIVKEQISDNGMFNRYFPNTSTFLSTSQFKSLLLSESDTWKGVVDCDIAFMTLRLIRHNLIKVADRKEAATDTVKKILSGTSLQDNDGVQAVVKSWLDFNDTMKTGMTTIEGRLAGSASCNTKDDKDIRDTLTKIKESWQSFRNSVRSARISPEELSGLNITDVDGSLPYIVKVLIKNIVKTDQIANSIMRLYDVLSDQDKKAKNVVTSVYALAAIRGLIELRLVYDKPGMTDEPTERMSLTSKHWHRFERFVTAFASLADAKTVDATKVALQTLTLPPVSFAMKRDTNETSLFFTSYLGAQFTRSDYTEENDRIQLFAPLGFEVTSVLENVSIMYAPLDFAHPISLALHDTQAEIGWRDLVRHSLVISYGFDDMPLSAGFAVSKGAPISAPEAEDEYFYGVFIAFDMPLFHIW